LSKKKTETKTTQQQSGTSAFNNTNTYGQIVPIDTPDTQAFRDYRPEIDPSIAYGAAEAKNRLNQSFINPLGGRYSPHIEDAIKRTENRRIDQDASQAFRVGQNDVNRARQGQLGTLAALTAPRIVNTGSSGTGSSTGTMSGTGTMVERGGLFNDILSAARAGASIASGGKGGG